MNAVNSDATIFTTKNYGMFKRIVGNRPRNEAHVIRLMKSFKKEYLFTLLIVNEFFEIIDGQHRLEACSRLGLEVNYRIIPGLRLKDCQRYNTVDKIWGKSAFLESYCELDTKPYKQLKEFMTNYPEFSIGVAEAIMTNNIAGVNNRKRLQKGAKNDSERIHFFQEGLFKVPDLKLAYENAAKIVEYKSYFKYYNNGAFVRTLIPLFKNPKFNHELMLQKLEKQPTSLVRCASVEQYKLLIESIYNYRSKNPVNLRYAK
jgi:hypothetical protein